VNSASELALRILTLNSLLFFIFLMALSILFLKNFKLRFDITNSQYFLISASINVILSLTLRWWNWEGSPSVFWLANSNSWKAALDLNSNWIFNFLLFIPTAFLLKKYLIGAPSTIILLTFSSFSIETIQGIFEWGSSDPIDWVANTCGARFGALLAKFRQKRMF
jgi:glycopeptide antibiotics resistance protein